jgi:hypothetical protein
MDYFGAPSPRLKCVPVISWIPEATNGEPVKNSELREILSQISLHTPMRMGLEAFTEPQRGWIEGVNLLIHIEALQDAEGLLSIIESRGMSWKIVRRSENTFLCIY